MQSKKKQIQEYLALNVNTFVQPMVYQIVRRRPADPAAFAVQWLQEYLAKRSSSMIPLISNNSGEEDACLLNEKAKHRGKKRTRRGYSEEVFGIFNKPQSTSVRNIPKTSEDRSLIMNLIKESVLLANLGEKEERTVVNAMQEKHLTKGEHVMTEGQKGDTLLLVAEGEFDCFKKIEGCEKYLKTFVKGESFGELALMYDAPRAATVISNGNGKVFALDRITLNQIVKQAEIKKRELIQNVISNASIFAQISDSDEQNFYQRLKEQTYEPGSYITNQGDTPNHFYIVLNGKLQAEKKNLNDPHSPPEKVYDYEEGEYFGELALLHNCKRQASVKTLTKTTLAYIEKEDFMKVLGSFEKILRRNQEKYKNVVLV